MRVSCLTSNGRKAVMLAAAIVALAQPVCASDDWIAYTAADRSFSVSFPYVPAVRHTQEGEARDIPVTGYIVAQHTPILFVSVRNMTGHQLSADPAKDEARRLERENTLVSEEKSGAGYSVTLKNVHGLIMEGRIVYAAPNVYDVIAVRPAATSGKVKDEASKFLDSFHLTPAAPPSRTPTGNPL